MTDPRPRAGGGQSLLAYCEPSIISSRTCVVLGAGLLVLAAGARMRPRCRAAHRLWLSRGNSLNSRVLRFGSGGARRSSHVGRFVSSVRTVPEPAPATTNHPRETGVELPHWPGHLRAITVADRVPMPPVCANTWRRPPARGPATATPTPSTSLSRRSIESGWHRACEQAVPRIPR